MFHDCFQLKPTMLAALTLASLSLLVWGSNLCPPSCQCLHNLTTVVCQVKELSRIPELPDGTEKLYVSYNNIQEIPRRGLEKLQVGNTQQQPENRTVHVGLFKMMQHCGLLRLAGGKTRVKFSMFVRQEIVRHIKPNKGFTCSNSSF